MLNIFFHFGSKFYISSFREILADFNGIRVPFNQPEILLNINTPEDYEKFINIT